MIYGPSFPLASAIQLWKEYISGILLPFCPIPSCTPIKKAKVNYLTGIFVGGGIVSASFTLGLFLAIMYKLYRGIQHEKRLAAIQWVLVGKLSPSTHSEKA